MGLKNYLKIDQFSIDEKFLTFVLILSLGLILFNNLSGSDLPSFDDAYYAQKAKEILSTGDLFTLHYGGVPRFDNTPFYIWLIALMFKLFGINEYNARFFSTVSCLGSMVSLFFIARIISKNKWVRFFSVFVLATTFWYTRYAMHAMFDVTLSFFYTLIILFFLLGITKSERYFLLSGIFVGFSILTKSLLGIFPWIIMVLFLLFYDSKKLLSRYFLLSILVSSVIALPWYLVEYFKYGERFVSEQFRWLFFERAFGKSVPGQNLFSYFYYIKFLLIGYLPWFPLGIAGIYTIIKRKREKKEDWLELLPIIWILTVLVIMTIPGSRKSWYIMPVFPAFALVVGKYLSENILKTEKRNFLFAKILSLTFFGIILILLFFPIPIKSRTFKDLSKMAPVIKRAVPKEQKVNCFAMEFWYANNSFLFYTDRMLKEPVNDIDSLKRIMEPEDEYCYMKTKDYESYFKDNKKEFPIIAGTKKYVCMTNERTYRKLSNYNFLDFEK